MSHLLLLIVPIESSKLLYFSPSFLLLINCMEVLEFFRLCRTWETHDKHNRNENIGKQKKSKYALDNNVCITQNFLCKLQAAPAKDHFMVFIWCSVLVLRCCVRIHPIKTRKLKASKRTECSSGILHTHRSQAQTNISFASFSVCVFVWQNDFLAEQF